MTMDRSSMETFQSRLEKMLQEEKESQEHIREGLRTSLRDSVDELSLYDNHPGDLGNPTFEREKDLGLLLYTEDRIAMIKEAMDCVGKGTYGLCESCGKEISRERLEVVPFTNLCQECKKSRESLERHPRPIEEDVISPNYGAPRGGLSGANNAFDGEDSWQAVARYGSSDSPSDIGSVDDYDDLYPGAYEDIGSVHDVEDIPVEIDEEGRLMKDFH